MAILIFDYDGTLHDSMHIYGPAVRKCHETLASAGLVTHRNISDEEIRSYLGLSIDEMWRLFAPEFTKEERASGGRYIGDELRKSVSEGRAVLYDGALELLLSLKAEGHKLIYLSNCTKSYKELHRKTFNLDRYFDEVYCSEEFGWKEKCEIARELIEKWASEAGEDNNEQSGRTPGLSESCHAARGGLQPVIAIGDRYKDINMGSVDSKLGKIKTIWCAYGFGSPEEGADADERADSVRDVKACVERIINNSV